MKAYQQWSPTSNDLKGLGLADRQDWFVVPVSQTRDSDAEDRSNFRSALYRLRGADSGNGDSNYEVHRFGHWGPGWFEIILVRPGSKAEKIATDIESDLESYPVLDEDDFCELEHQDANDLWAMMRQSERIDYIRDHYRDFEFRSFAEVLACARGRYFAGSPAELLEGR